MGCVIYTQITSFSKNSNSQDRYITLQKIFVCGVKNELILHFFNEKLLVYPNMVDGRDIIMAGNDISYAIKSRDLTKEIILMFISRLQSELTEKDVKWMKRRLSKEYKQLVYVEKDNETFKHFARFCISYLHEIKYRFYDNFVVFIEGLIESFTIDKGILCHVLLEDVLNHSLGYRTTDKIILTFGELAC